MGDRTRKSELFDQIARVGKALGSGKRLELLDLLAQGERTVESLATAAGLGVTTASAHLQSLKQARLVRTRREGTRVYYFLAGEDVAALYAALRDVAAAHLPDVDAARVAYLGLGDVHGRSAAEVPAEVSVLDRDELLARITAGEVLVLDVRPAVEYAAGHIPGAVSIPVDELSGRIEELPPDVEIVAYCRGAYCVMAHEAAALLTARGRRAARLTDGMLEWRVAGHRIDVGVA
jgi:rhodanese-related sulfurtransferase/DNA-binding transcriptional ArsR family regulator